MRPPRWRSDAGVSAVEFAILIPLFLIIVFGTLTGGFALNSKITLTQAAREGGRFGATLPIPPQPGQTESDWLTAVLQATKTAASGEFTAGQDNSSICVAFVDGTNSAFTEHMTLDITGATSVATAGPCWTDTTLGADNRVQVDVERDLSINIIFASMHPHSTTHASVEYDRQAP